MIEIWKASFEEIYLLFRTIQAEREASRCLKYGGHSICGWACLLHNRIPQWIELVKAGNIDTAVELSHQTNCLPEVTGHVCPQDRLCEGTCTIRSKYGAITIGDIECHISDRVLSKGWRPDLSHVREVDRRVAIIGTGPAGLTYTDVLAHSGASTSVYDRHPEIGGLLMFGIPASKLDKSLLARRHEIFNVMGIHFELSRGMGKDVTLEKLLEDYDTVFVSVGTYRSMKADPLNEDVPGIYDTLPLLITNTKQVMGLEGLPEGPFIGTAGLNVVVLGGGDTAMGCMQTALRHGTSQVTCAYRRDEVNIPGSEKEVENAREEGANFEPNVRPAELALHIDERVSGVCFLRTQPDGPDTQSHRHPAPIAGSEFVMPVDVVIMAFDFHPHGISWLESHDIKVDNWGRIAIDVESAYRYQTSNPRVFAGGDAVRGADLMVTTMAGGRHVAQGIVGRLGVKSVKSH